MCVSRFLGFVSHPTFPTAAAVHPSFDSVFFRVSTAEQSEGGGGAAGFRLQVGRSPKYLIRDFSRS